MMFSRKQFPICTDCQMKQIDQPIEDPEYKKFFDIPEKFYKESYFLRNIKSSYIRFGSITENQRDAFLKTVVDMKKGKKETKE